MANRKSVETVRRERISIANELTVLTCMLAEAQQLRDVDCNQSSHVVRAQTLKIKVAQRRLTQLDMKIRTGFGRFD